jgi:hypothetical protein
MLTLQKNDLKMNWNLSKHEIPEEEDDLADDEQAFTIDSSETGKMGESMKKGARWDKRKETNRRTGRTRGERGRYKSCRSNYLRALCKPSF